MKKILILCSVLLLCACSTPSLQILSRPIEIDVTKAADPAGVRMLPVHFRVVTSETLDSFMSELRTSQGSSPVFIAINTRDYENMSLNLADLRRYIQQQQAVIVYYRNMTSPPAREP